MSALPGMKERTILLGGLSKNYAMTGWRCLLYTSDAADERSSVDLGGRRIINKKTHSHDTTDMCDVESESAAGAQPDKALMRDRAGVGHDA